MKKTIYNSVFVAVIAILCSSCMALHNGYMMNSSASLSQSNFTYVKKDITGIAIVDYFLLFGGYNTETLVGKAKQNMLRDNPLTDNQALVNLTVSYKTTFTIFPYVQVECVITADVVEFK